MCGIAGTVGWDTKRYVKIMNAAQIHRGPDDEGVFFDAQNQVCIGMRRLSIVDLASGHQPMQNEDGKIHIVFNGEIFNAPELRRDLVAEGHKFYTRNSDTEVLVHLYEQYGKDMLLKLNGMFAFLIYDENKRQLFAARDHTGIKPLYYARLGDKLLLASELKCILATKLVQETINMASVYQYLSLQFIPAPNTIFNEIKKLEAASFLIYNIDSQSIQVEKYWFPHFSKKEKMRNEDLDILIKEEFKAAVKRWRISDVPVASSLSGGIDSVAIVSVLQREGAQVDTYTLGFSDAPECDEHLLARSVARDFNTRHHEIVLTLDELLTDLDRMIYALDEPYAGGLPSWYVFKEMSKEFKVGFSGLGGDELFGNYGKWIRYENILAHGIRIGWELLNRESILELKTYPKGSIYHKYMTEGMKSRIFAQGHKAGIPKEANINYLYEKMIKECPERRWRDRIPWIDLQMQLPDEFLHMTDRFSMYHSLEARTPFLDKEFVELIYSIPAGKRTREKGLKYLFVDAMKDYLPESVIGAPKKGFVLPYHKWLNNDLKSMVYEYTSEGFLKEQGIFDNSIRKILIEPYYKGRGYLYPLVWTVLMFQLWYTRYCGKEI